MDDDWFSIKNNIAGSGVVNPRDHVEEGRLPRTVGSNHAENASPLDPEINAVHSGETTENFRDPFSNKQRFRGGGRSLYVLGGRVHFAASDSNPDTGTPTSPGFSNVSCRPSSAPLAWQQAFRPNQHRDHQCEPEDDKTVTAEIVVLES